jgi:hypothetical protein
MEAQLASQRVEIQMLKETMANFAVQADLATVSYSTGLPLCVCVVCGVESDHQRACVLRALACVTPFPAFL